jgi:hypothetical protein
MDPQQVIDGVWTATGLAVSAAFIGVLFGLIQTYAPFLDTQNTTVRNYTLGVLCALLVGVASYQLGQQGVQPSVANIIGAIIAFAGLFRLSLSLNSDTVQTTTGSRPPSLLGPDKPVLTEADAAADLAGTPRPDNPSV